MYYVKMCKQCVKTPEDDIHNGYYPFIRADNYICPDCNSELIDTILTREEYLTIDGISSEPSFIQTMINLKQDDIIEYQLKLNQFKIQLQQLKNLKNEGEEQQKTDLPHCPTCNSTNIKQISEKRRTSSVVWLGAASDLVGKTFECQNCGYLW